MEINTELLKKIIKEGIADNSKAISADPEWKVDTAFDIGIIEGQLVSINVKADAPINYPVIDDEHLCIVESVADVDDDRKPKFRQIMKVDDYVVFPDHASFEDIKYVVDRFIVSGAIIKNQDEFWHNAKFNPSMVWWHRLGLVMRGKPSLTVMDNYNEVDISTILKDRPALDEKSADHADDPLVKKLTTMLEDKLPSVQPILADEREIERVVFDDPDETLIVAGNGIAIRAYPEPGQSLFVPWIAVYKGDEIEMRFPASMVTICYKTEE